MTDALQVPCPWCNADAGLSCVTLAAHPVHGRAVLIAVEPHQERLDLLDLSHTIPATHTDQEATMPVSLSKPVPANIVDLQHALLTDPNRLSLAVARAFATAGALSEWDSGTIEEVFEELYLGLPAGVPLVDDTDYWRAIADQVGIEHDGPDEDDDTVGPDDSEDDTDRRTAGLR